MRSIMLLYTTPVAGSAMLCLSEKYARACSYMLSFLWDVQDFQVWTCKIFKFGRCKICKIFKFGTCKIFKIVFPIISRAKRAK